MNRAHVKRSLLVLRERWTRHILQTVVSPIVRRLARSRVLQPAQQVLASTFPLGAPAARVHARKHASGSGS